MARAPSWSRASSTPCASSPERTSQTKTRFNDFAVVVMSAWSDRIPEQTIAAAARAEVEALLGRDDLPDPPDGATLAEVLDHWSEQLEGQLLLVFDQFEEYFRYHDDDERKAGTFDAEFPEAVNRRDVRANFLLSIRDDELARLDHFKGRIPRLFDNRVKIDHLTRAGAEMAIRRPIEEHTERFQPSSRSSPQTDSSRRCSPSARSRARPSAKAPTCASTRSRRPPSSSCSSGSGATPSRPGSTRSRRRSSEARRRQGDSRELRRRRARPRSRRPSRRSSQDASASSPAPPRQRSLTPRPSSQEWRGETSDEVTAVLDKLSDRRDRRILNAVDTGQGEGSKSYELFNADLLAEPVVKWQKAYDEEQRRKAEEERRRALRRKYRNRSIVLVTLARSSPHRRRAVVNSVNAKHATDEGEVDRSRIHRKYRAPYPPRHLAAPEPSGIRHETICRGGEQHDLGARGGSEVRGEAILHGHTDQVTAVAYSPDGRTLATGSWDSTVRLWDVATHTQLGAPLLGHDDTVNSIAFSPDGRHARDRQRRQDGAAVGRGHAQATRQAAPGPKEARRERRLQPGWANTRDGRRRQGTCGCGTWRRTSNAASRSAATRERSTASPSALTGTHSLPAAGTMLSGVTRERAQPHSPNRDVPTASGKSGGRLQP